MSIRPIKSDVVRVSPVSQLERFSHRSFVCSASGRDFESSASASSATPGQQFKIACPRLPLKKSTGHSQPATGLACFQGLVYSPARQGSPPRNNRAVPRLGMATVTPLSEEARPQHRGPSFWMDRVVAELENGGSS